MMLNVNTTKWLQLEPADSFELFKQCKEIEMVSFGVTRMLLDANQKWTEMENRLCGKDFVMFVHNIQALEQLVEYLSKLVKAYYKLSPKLARLGTNTQDHSMLLSKRNFMTDILCRRRYILLNTTHALVTTIMRSCLFREDIRKLMELFFSIILLYNELLGLSNKSFVSKFNVCSNACPIVITQTKKISITKIVQNLAKSRAEHNCHRLIRCLVQNYKPSTASENDACSNTSSIEIYHTLTKHITPPVSGVSKDQSKPHISVPLENKKVPYPKSVIKTEKADESTANIQSKIPIKEFPCHTPINTLEFGLTSDSEVPYSSLVEHDETETEYEDQEETINSLLQNEEIYVEILLDTALRMAPSMLGNDGVKKLKTGEVRVARKSALRVMEYYQNVLWGEVGGCLEHVVLWWTETPLAAKSPQTSQNLREWLMTFNVNNTPMLILTTLRSLAESLGCHVTSTSWDKLFGATLVTNLNPTKTKMHPDVTLVETECSETGANFAILLQDLVSLSNQCEVTGDYILGAPVNELPLVEQIPILHRLDHSIHTCRLWCLAETRKLANMWNMNAFFRITQNDILACMEQLTNLRFADHSVSIESGNVGVHEHVCAKMREKLVSEVKVNIQKLKQSPDECIQVLSSVCMTTSLANLTMIFPTHYDWYRVSKPPEPGHSKYVHNFLDRMLLPVVNATQDKIIVNLLLRLICESWLHHIYVSKVKFSNAAAVQLLADFDAVKLWLNECSILTKTTRKQMLNNEVLRRCEGVGRLLLHSPGDPISMQDSTSQSFQQIRKEGSEDSEPTGQMMPAEMYVPNQQQWLSLRASKFRSAPFCLPVCCNGL